ncbi:hypothetical protein BD311DRAFT_750800 [Dichomitus squalens]|uniref:Secreted protein n=1 Tax=Dichomitus squalens TaxID=114155 RepID=A0A4Q9N0Y7_9APHY|nr:hypothetical protein BD311DRAFT_750800 [Dichomitus squalens]
MRTAAPMLYLVIFSLSRLRHSEPTSSVRPSICPPLRRLVAGHHRKWSKWSNKSFTEDLPKLRSNRTPSPSRLRQARV